jgi:hypothetical protein
LRRTRIFEVNVPHRPGVFICNEKLPFTLEDLKREVHIIGARDSWQIALDLWITLRPVFSVIISLRKRLWQIWDLAANYYSLPGRHRTNRTKCKHLCSGHWNHRTWLHGKRRAGRMRFNIPIRVPKCLPDTVKVRLS